MVKDRCILNVKIDCDWVIIGQMMERWYDWGIPTYLQYQWLTSIFGLTGTIADVTQHMTNYHKNHMF